MGFRLVRNTGLHRLSRATMAALLRRRRAEAVASPLATPDYSMFPLLPTLRGRSGCYTLNAGFPSTVLSFAGFDRAAFDFRRAGLGHYRLVPDTSLRFRQETHSCWVRLCSQTVFPERSACPVVSMPFGRQNPTLLCLSHACYLALPAIARFDISRHLAAHPLVMPRALACWLGPRDYPWRHRWERWLDMASWAPSRDVHVLRFVGAGEPDTSRHHMFLPYPAPSRMNQANLIRHP